ncbi:MAG TPA: helix-turn-helix transcriptional regulator [Pyrinomonadaceae bacterium]|nr:helix-turn-helix transcriptional regulator [Pyrinomonadaceae bacterium]
MVRARTKRAQRQSSKSAHKLVRTRPDSKRKRPYPRKLADKLRQLREELEMSQGDIAAKVGVKDRASISGYERGEREPPLPVLLAYARLGKVRVENLIDDELDLP